MKKLLAFVLVLALACGLFAAGSKEAASNAGGPIEITLLTYDGVRDANGKLNIETVAEEYMKRNPNVKVNIDLQAENDSIEFLKKLDLLQLSGDTAEVIHVPSFREYALRAEKGFFRPIDDLIAGEGISYDSEYGYPTQINGKSYGIPFEPGIYGVLINKDMLDAAGLPIPEEGWTWDDYATYAKAMTKGSGASKIYGSFMHSWSEFKREGLFNVVMDNPYVKEDGTSNLDSPYFRTWLEYMWKLEQVDKSQVPYADMKATGMHYRDVFMNGQVAMIPIGTWMFDTVIDVAKYPHTFQTIFAPFPVFEDGKPGVTQGSASYFVIGANTTDEKAKAAYDFMRWYSGDGSVLLDKFPATRSGDLIGVLRSKVGSRTDLLDVDSVETVWNSPNMVANIIGRDAALFSEIDNVYNTEVELYLLGTQSLDKTLENVSKQADTIIRNK